MIPISSEEIQGQHKKPETVSQELNGTRNRTPRAIFYGRFEAIVIYVEAEEGGKMKAWAVPISIGFVFFLTMSIVQAADFSAEVFNTHQGQATQAKIYVQTDKIRMDTPGTDEYTILRTDKRVIWIVIPEEKSYLEIRSSQPRESDVKMKGEVRRHYLSSETLNGHATKKYEVHYLDKDTLHKAHQWIATDLNYPIKISALDGSWSTEYRNIRIGSQPDSLFEIPEGFDMISRSGPPPSESETDTNPPAKGK
jgi:hypothetical protein